MARRCTVCDHPKRQQIDQELAHRQAARRRIAARYGLPETNVRRHENQCLDPALIAVHERTLEAQSLKARDIILETVQQLREEAATMRGLRKDQWLEVIDRLVRANEQYAKINKELGADQVNAFFVTYGVRDEQELRARLSVSRSGESMTPLDAQEEALTTLQMLWKRHPELREEGLQRLGQSSYALIEGETNGKAES